MTFDFTMDAFPGYTYFDKTKEVLCVFQIVDDTIDNGSEGNPVMYHDDDTDNNDDFINYRKDSAEE